MATVRTSLDTRTPPESSLLGIVKPLRGVTFALAHRRDEWNCPLQFLQHVGWQDTLHTTYTAPAKAANAPSPKPTITGPPSALSGLVDLGNVNFSATVGDFTKLKPYI